MMSLRFIGVFALLLSAMLWSCATSAQQLTVIELKHRTAAEIMPVLQPLISKEAGLSGQDYRLFVRANAPDVSRIREALIILDRAPKQLLISVRYAARSDIDGERMRVSGQVSNNDARLDIEARRRVGTMDATNTSSVRVIEGQQAQIATGQSSPVVTAFAAPGVGHGTGVVLSERTATTGFTVLPRVNGTEVIVEVFAQQEQPSDRTTSSQRVESTVMGKIGEWLELGGANTVIESRRSTLSGTATRTHSDGRTIWLRVDAEVTPTRTP